MARRPPKEEYVVIGLGRFGASLALKLMELGHSVLAIDRDRALVQALADEVTQTVALDATDEDALRTIGIESFGTAIVAIGDDFENNVLITVLLKDLKIKRVISKALNERQKSILLKVGADQVILPEHEAGIRLAQQLVSPLVIDRLELEPGVSVSELRCPSALFGRTLRELNLRERFRVTVLIIKGQELRASPSGSDRINPGDTLIVIGPDEGIARLQELPG